MPVLLPSTTSGGKAPRCTHSFNDLDPLHLSFSLGLDAVLRMLFTSTQKKTNDLELADKTVLYVFHPVNRGAAYVFPLMCFVWPCKRGSIIHPVLTIHITDTKKRISIKLR